MGKFKARDFTTSVGSLNASIRALLLCKLWTSCGQISAPSPYSTTYKRNNWWWYSIWQFDNFDPYCQIQFLTCSCSDTCACIKEETSTSTGCIVHCWGFLTFSERYLEGKWGGKVYSWHMFSITTTYVLLKLLLTFSLSRTAVFHILLKMWWPWM